MENKSVTVTTADKQSGRKVLGDITNLAVPSEAKNPKAENSNNKLQKSSSSLGESTRKILAELTGDVDKNNKLLSHKLQFLSRLTLAAYEKRVSSLIEGGDSQLQKKKTLQTRNEILALLDQGANMNTVIQNLVADTNKKIKTYGKDQEKVRQTLEFIQWVIEDAQILSEDHAKSRENQESKVATPTNPKEISAEKVTREQTETKSAMTTAPALNKNLYEKLVSFFKTNSKIYNKKDFHSLIEKGNRLHQKKYNEIEQSRDEILDLLNEGANIDKVVQMLSTRVENRKNTYNNNQRKINKADESLAGIIEVANLFSKVFVETQKNEDIASSIPEHTSQESAVYDGSFFSPKNEGVTLNPAAEKAVEKVVLEPTDAQPTTTTTAPVLENSKQISSNHSALCLVM